MGSCDVESRPRLRRTPSHRDLAADALRVWWDRPPVEAAPVTMFKDWGEIHISPAPGAVDAGDQARLDLLDAVQHLLDDLVEQVHTEPFDWGFLDAHVEYPVLDVGGIATLVISQVVGTSITAMAPPVMSVRASVSHLVAA